MTGGIGMTAAVSDVMVRAAIDAAENAGGFAREDSRASRERVFRAALEAGLAKVLAENADLSRQVMAFQSGEGYELGVIHGSAGVGKEIDRLRARVAEVDELAREHCEESERQFDRVGRARDALDEATRAPIPFVEYEEQGGELAQYVDGVRTGRSFVVTAVLRALDGPEPTVASTDASSSPLPDRCGWLCDLPPGHDGDHRASLGDGIALFAWPWSANLEEAVRDVEAALEPTSNLPDHLSVQVEATSSLSSSPASSDTPACPHGHRCIRCSIEKKRRTASTRPDTPEEIADYTATASALMPWQLEAMAELDREDGGDQ